MAGRGWTGTICGRAGRRTGSSSAPRSLRWPRANAIKKTDLFWERRQTSLWCPFGRDDRPLFGAQRDQEDRPLLGGRRLNTDTVANTEWSTEPRLLQPPTPLFTAPAEKSFDSAGGGWMTLSEPASASAHSLPAHPRLAGTRTDPASRHRRTLGMPRLSSRLRHKIIRPLHQPARAATLPTLLLRIAPCTMPAAVETADLNITSVGHDVASQPFRSPPPPGTHRKAGPPQHLKAWPPSASQRASLPPSPSSPSQGRTCTATQVPCNHRTSPCCIPSAP